MNGWLGSGYKDECKLFVERHYFSAVYRFLPFEQRHSGEGGGWWYDVLYFEGVVLSPFQLVGTMLSHGAPGNLGEKFHPARPEASNPYGAGNFSPVQTSSPISPLSCRLRKPGYRFTEWAAYIVERSCLTAARRRRWNVPIGSFYARLIFFPFFKPTRSNTYLKIISVSSKFIS